MEGLEGRNQGGYMIAIEMVPAGVHNRSGLIQKDGKPDIVHNSNSLRCPY